MFKIDLERLQTDEDVYLKRCMHNHLIFPYQSMKIKTYKFPNNVFVDITSWDLIWWKNGNMHRDNDKPAVIRFDGTKEWLKNGKRHRDNDKPAILQNGFKRWYKNGEEYEPM
jgi:hypothetical protein